MEKLLEKWLWKLRASELKLENAPPQNYRGFKSQLFTNPSH